MAIAPDDLVPGMFVTVLDTTVERPHPFAQATGKETFEMKDYAGSGVVLQVLATSFPFVLVRNHTTQILPSPKVFPIDLRRSDRVQQVSGYRRACSSVRGRSLPDSLPPKVDVRRSGNRDLLPRGDFEAVARAAVSIGADHVKLTGGRPTVGSDLVDILRRGPPYGKSSLDRRGGGGHTV